MRTVLAWLEKHPAIWRLALSAAAMLFGAGAVVMFGFGGCHDSGGFCADEFSSTHVEAYASGAFLAALATLAVCLTITRRPTVVAAAPVGVAVFAGLVAFLVESTIEAQPTCGQPPLYASVPAQAGA